MVASITIQIAIKQVVVLDGKEMVVEDILIVPSNLLIMFKEDGLNQNL